MGKSLTNAPPRVKRSEKKFQAAKEESYPGEIELENKGSNENWRFTYKLVVNCLKLSMTYPSIGT